ncbi:MAG: hypothetical protein HY330_06145 [Chloroflexi bacterium]|nr:hypothetical protein [Chloroflexota bacterium]
MPGSAVRLWIVVIGSVLAAGVALAVAVIPDDWRLAARLSTGLLYAVIVLFAIGALALRLRRRGGA